MANEPLTNPKFKSKLCLNFMETGECNFGMSCNFAHGEYELLQQNPVSGATSAGPKGIDVRYKSNILCSIYRL